MKKSLIAMVVLLAVAVTSLGVSSLALDRSGEQVEIRETTLMGDRSAAQGLNLRMNLHFNEHLRWTTELSSDKKPETAMRFSWSGLPNAFPASEQVLLYGGDMNLSSSGSLSLPDGDMEFVGLNELLMDVADRTQAGGTNVETLRYRDYYSFYPLSVSLLRRDGYLDWHELQYMDLAENPHYQILTDLAQAFQFPVEEDHLVKASVTKHETGEISSLDVRSEHTPNIAALSAPADQYLYFVVSAYTEEGELVDYSRTPGGYGLYRLPREGDLSIGQLEMVLPLEPGENVLEMTEKPGGEDLLMVEHRDGAYLLRVLDGATGQEKQSLPLWEVGDPGSSSYFGQAVYDDFLVIYGEKNRFHVFQDTGSGYIPALSGTLADFTTLGGGELERVNRMDAQVFDGTRLAEVYGTHYGDGQNRMLRLVLVVYDADGIAYAGVLDNSMDLCISGHVEWRDKCQLLERNAIQLEWTHTAP